MASLIRFLAFSFLVFTLGCYGGSSPGDKGKELADRDPKLAQKLVSEGALLLDVRTLAEFEEGYVKGAVNIPVEELEGRLAEIEKLQAKDFKKPIVIYCRSGGRASRAKNLLKKKGYTMITNMGGLKDWPDAKTLCKNGSCK